MFLIKITDLLENLSSVDGCPCTGGKDFLLFFTGMNILTLTSGLRPAQCTVLIARIVQSVSVVKLDHSRSTGECFFMPAYGGKHFFDKIRCHFDVIV